MYIATSMFEYLDLVNIMVYDFTGGWKSSKVAQHASTGTLPHGSQTLE